jgi:hypothetical protein
MRRTCDDYIGVILMRVGLRDEPDAAPVSSA